MNHQVKFERIDNGSVEGVIKRYLDDGWELLFLDLTYQDTHLNQAVFVREVPIGVPSEGENTNESPA